MFIIVDGMKNGLILCGLLFIRDVWFFLISLRLLILELIVVLMWVVFFFVILRLEFCMV